MQRLPLGTFSFTTTYVNNLSNLQERRIPRQRRTENGVTSRVAAPEKKRAAEGGRWATASHRTDDAFVLHARHAKNLSNYARILQKLWNSNAVFKPDIIIVTECVQK